MTDTSREFVDSALDRGIDFFTGVPCSYLIRLFSEIERRKLHYWPATREDSACGVAAGAYLAGRQPLVLMQNSGFGNSINSICSLLLTYQIPMVLVVSWRGEPGTDSIEHTQMGSTFVHLLEALHLKHISLRDLGPSRAMREAHQLSLNSNAPVVIIVRKGDF